MREVNDSRLIALLRFFPVRPRCPSTISIQLQLLQYILLPPGFVMTTLEDFESRPRRENQVLSDVVHPLFWCKISCLRPVVN